MNVQVGAGAVPMAFRGVGPRGGGGGGGASRPSEGTPPGAQRRVGSEGIKKRLRGPKKGQLWEPSEGGSGFAALILRQGPHQCVIRQSYRYANNTSNSLNLRNLNKYDNSNEDA